MGKVVVSQFISVDGVVEDPGGSESWEGGGWAFRFDRGDEGNKFKLDEVMASQALLLGRVTYEGFAEAASGCLARRQADVRRGGKRMFGETPAATALRLVDAKPAGETYILVYEPSPRENHA
jgi:dihydrofolate reductase